MKAMLFAAGKGTRLQPLTDQSPKCLVTAGGKTLLEHNLLALKKAGVTSVVVNIHHLGEQIIDFLDNHDFGLDIQISVEDELLETGGGLLKAADHFRGEKAFLVCNSDIFTDLDLQLIMTAHQKNNNLATLAVSDRKTSRYLRFSEDNLLCGWENRSSGEHVSWGTEAYRTLAFNGIQVMSSEIFAYMTDYDAAFSTIPVYLKAAQAGEKIAAFPMDTAFWIDIGSIEKLDKLRAYFQDLS
ncbi:nucleotidyltransferase family protein [bacterium]|nr:nucleotidyltransferase family protein [bacterium]